MPEAKRIAFDVGGTLAGKAPGGVFAAAVARARFDRTPAGLAFHVRASRLRGAPIFGQTTHGVGSGNSRLGRNGVVNGATHRPLVRRWRSGD